MGVTGLNPSSDIMLGRDGGAGGAGRRSNMQRRRRECAKKMVVARRIIMKRMWISWPRAERVRARERSVFVSFISKSM